MAPGDKSDSELLRMLRSEDAAERNAVFAYFLERYGGEVKKEVRRRAGDRVDYEPILDEAILRIHKAVQDGRYDASRKKLIPFFFGIVHNLIKSAIRNKQRRDKHHENYRLLWEQNESNAENSPEQRLLAMEERERIAKALEQLDEPCREILDRYWMKEEKLKDIGKDLGLTDENIRQKHLRCLKKLKEILKKMPK